MRAVGFLRIRLFFREIGDRDIRPFPRKGNRIGAPDTGISTGHERLAPLPIDYLRNQRGTTAIAACSMGWFAGLRRAA